MGDIRKRLDQIEARLEGPTRGRGARIVIYDPDRDPGGEKAAREAAGAPVLVFIPDNKRGDRK